MLQNAESVNKERVITKSPAMASNPAQEPSAPKPDNEEEKARGSADDTKMLQTVDTEGRKPKM